MPIHEVPQEFINYANKIQNPIIADIGSRDAIDCLYLYEQLEAGALHIFEPNPIAIDICKKNIAAHKKNKNIFLRHKLLPNLPWRINAVYEKKA
ncbi:MAG: hypothetical protein QM484_14730 [Woeseiaceae bacterium]